MADQTDAEKLAAHYSQYTISQLKDLAGENGVPVPSKMNKQEICELLAHDDIRRRDLTALRDKVEQDRQARNEKMATMRAKEIADLRAREIADTAKIVDLANKTKVIVDHESAMRVRIHDLVAQLHQMRDNATPRNVLETSNDIEVVRKAGLERGDMIALHVQLLDAETKYTEIRIEALKLMHGII